MQERRVVYMCRVGIMAAARPAELRDDVQQESFKLIIGPVYCSVLMGTSCSRLHGHTEWNRALIQKHPADQNTLMPHRVISVPGPETILFKKEGFLCEGDPIWFLSKQIWFLRTDLELFSFDNLNCWIVMFPFSQTKMSFRKVLVATTEKNKALFVHV